MNEKAMSCVEPARGPLVAAKTQTPGSNDSQVRVKEEEMATAHVGREAPDFEANAFVNGEFKNIRLSDYRGQWVVL